MKRLDEGKVSLVDFLRSIKYANHSNSKCHDECPTQFAGLNPHTPADKKSNSEELYLVRSAN